MKTLFHYLAYANAILRNVKPIGSRFRLLKGTGYAIRRIARE
jgi:hypothetical protein